MLARLPRLVALAALALAACAWATGPDLTAWAADKAPAAEPPAPEPSTLPDASTPIPEATKYGGPGGYNYYVHPGAAGLVGAELYLSPRPTPPLVGHTYVTYPPLMPHEFLYKHRRVYRTYNEGSGWTTTRARWR